MPSTSHLACCTEGILLLLSNGRIKQEYASAADQGLHMASSLDPLEPLLPAFAGPKIQVIICFWRSHLRCAKRAVPLNVADIRDTHAVTGCC